MNSKFNKYLKYKNKYLELKKQYGGKIKNLQMVEEGIFIDDEKTILLSVPEFNEVVDNFILLDNHSKINRNGIIIPISSLAELNVEDNNFGSIDRAKYTKFCSQSRFKDSRDTEKLYLRKINKLESDSFLRGFINWNTYDDKTPDIKMDSTTIKKLEVQK